MREYQVNVPSKERFIGWLQRKPLERVVAEHWDMWSCPICQFLNDQGWTMACLMAGDAGKFICNYDTKVDDQGTSLLAACPTPDWMRSFAYWADQCVERRLTAEECLFLLDLPYFNRKWS